MAESPPAGWYADPYGMAPQRYWDGMRWTHHLSQPAAPRPPPPPPPAQPRPTRAEQARQTREDRLDAANNATLPGWYDDPDTRGGTTYWDGSRWTGHTRPRRRIFAARARDSSNRAFVPLALMGTAGFGYICVAAAYEDEFEVGYLIAGVLVVAAGLLYALYTLRGRGPTTAEVKAHIASVRQKDDWDYDDAQATSEAQPGGFRSFIWRTMFNEGRAQSAYERGDADFEARLRVDNGEFRHKVREIEGQGWRMVHRSLHKKDRQADTQHATYYFVRDDD